MTTLLLTIGSSATKAQTVLWSGSQVIDSQNKHGNGELKQAVSVAEQVTIVEGDIIRMEMADGTDGGDDDSNFYLVMGIQKSDDSWYTPNSVNWKHLMTGQTSFDYLITADDVTNGIKQISVEGRNFKLKSVKYISKKAPEARYTIFEGSKEMKGSTNIEPEGIGYGVAEGDQIVYTVSELAEGTTHFVVSFHVWSESANAWQDIDNWDWKHNVGTYTSAAMSADFAAAAQQYNKFQIKCAETQSYSETESKDVKDNDKSITITKIEILKAQQTLTVSSEAKDGDFHYATLFSDKSLVVPTGCEAGSVNVTDSKLAFNYQWTAGKVIPANTGVVVKAVAADDYLFVVSNGEADALEGTNLLSGSVSEATTEGSGKFYGLGKGSNGLGFYWGAEDGAAFMNHAGHAYLVVPGDADVKAFVFSEDTATAIAAFKATSDTAPIYNLAGQRLRIGEQGSGMRVGYRGIAIRGGKKVILK